MSSILYDQGPHGDGAFIIRTTAAATKTNLCHPLYESVLRDHYFMSFGSPAKSRMELNQTNLTARRQFAREILHQKLSTGRRFWEYFYYFLLCVGFLEYKNSILNFPKSEAVICVVVP